MEAAEASAEFTDCDPVPINKNFIKDVAVSGIACSETPPLLAPLGDPDPASGFAKLTESLCCSVSIGWIGDGTIDVVYYFGV